MRIPGQLPYDTFAFVLSTWRYTVALPTGTGALLIIGWVCHGLGLSSMPVTQWRRSRPPWLGRTRVMVPGPGRHHWGAGPAASIMILGLKTSANCPPIMTDSFFMINYTYYDTIITYYDTIISIFFNASRLLWPIIVFSGNVLLFQLFHSYYDIIFFACFMTIIAILTYYFNSNYFVNSFLECYYKNYFFFGCIVSIMAIITLLRHYSLS